MAFSDVGSYISFIIGASSLILHIVVLYVIVLSPARRLFSGVFWQTYVLHSLNAVILSVLYNFIHRWRNDPVVAHLVLTYLPSEGFVPTIIIAVFNIVSVGIVLTNLLINFNRFTVLYLKQKHTAFWNRYYLWFQSFIVIIQFVAASNAFFVDVRITGKEEFQLYRWDGARVIPYFKICVLNFINVVISTAISVIFTTYIIISLILHRKALQHEFKIKQSDIKLCIFSSLMFVGYSGLAFSQIAFVFGAGEDLSYLQMMTWQSYFMDTCLYMAPWALLGTSTLLQKAMRSLLRCSLGDTVNSLDSTVLTSRVANATVRPTPPRTRPTFLMTQKWSEFSTTSRR